MTLREMRESLALTQEDVAARCQLPQAHISKLELGKFRNPGVQTLAQLADGLGVPLPVVIAAHTATLASKEAA